MIQWVNVRKLVHMCLAAQSCPIPCDPIDCSPPGSSVYGDSPGKNTEWVAIPSTRDLLNPRIELKSPALQAGSLLSEPLGKLMNTGMGSLSLLQRIFPTQE